MKEYVLQLLEELVGSHTHGQKQAKADEIAALVKTAVFPADQADELPPAEAAQQAPDNPAAENSTLSPLANEGPLIPSEDHHE